MLTATFPSSNVKVTNLLATVAAAPAARCRVAEQAARAAYLADGLGMTLRALREYQADCETCKLHGCCQTPGWNISLDTALRDIAHEWGLI